MDGLCRSHSAGSFLRNVLRRGTVAEVDAKGMATVELTPDPRQHVDLPSLGSASKFQTAAEDPGPDTSGKNTSISHSGSDRVFFLLKVINYPIGSCIQSLRTLDSMDGGLAEAAEGCAPLVPLAHDTH